MKRFLGLPSSIPNTIFSKIMMNTVQVTTEARVRLLKKIGIRFGLEEQEEAQINEIDQEEIFIKSFPSNFKVLFAFWLEGTATFLTATAGARETDGKLHLPTCRPRFRCLV